MIRVHAEVPGSADVAALVDLLLHGAGLNFRGRAELWQQLADGLGDGLDALPPPAPHQTPGSDL